MKRNYRISETGSIDYQDLIQQIAFHEAGHAVGIYLYNKEKHLPPVFFQIMLKSPEFAINPPLNLGSLSHLAEIEGGRLTQDLPVDLLESTLYFSGTEQDCYRTAFEADIINLLIGSLAEAKHVALRDQGHFNVQGVKIETLHRYGGTSDLKEVYDYLESIIVCKQRREETITALFSQALRFIADPMHWRAIDYLARYILIHREHTISCEQAIAVIDETISQRPLDKSGMDLSAFPQSEPVFRPACSV